jgi:ribonuclease E
MATCPECEFDEIDTTDHEEGDELSCPECGKMLVLAGPDDLEVADDDDDDDDDDDLDDDEEESEDIEEDDEGEGMFDEEEDFDEQEDE